MIKKYLLHPHQTEDEHCQDVPPKRCSFCFELHANDRVLGTSCSAREGQPRGSMGDTPCPVPEQLFQSPGCFTGSLARGPGVLFAFSIFLSAVLQVMAHTMYMLSQSSVPPTLFQDASSWGDLSSFELFEEADFSPSQHDAGKARQLQQREGSVNRSAGEPSTRANRRKLSEGSLDLPKPFPPVRPSTIPRVILRKKRGQASSVATGHSSSLILADVSSSTPKRSPVKSLPFSPSQVEHNFCTAVTNFQQTPEP